MIAGASNGNQTCISVKVLRTAGLEPRELTFCLLAFPEGKCIAVKKRITAYLLQLRQMKSETLQAAVRNILGFIGCMDLVKWRQSRFSG